MFKKKGFIIVFMGFLLTSSNVFAVAQQDGGAGHIIKLIVNHNANNDEIYITTDHPAPLCSAMTLRTNDPNVGLVSYKTLFSTLLAVKISGRRIQPFTDLSCNLFRIDILD